MRETRKDALQILDKLAGLRAEATASAILELRTRNCDSEAENLTKVVAQRSIDDVVTILEKLRREPACRRDLGELISGLATRPPYETAKSVAELRRLLFHKEADRILKIAARRPGPELLQLREELSRVGRGNDAALMQLIHTRRGNSAAR
jgi:hypothetical protein